MVETGGDDPIWASPQAGDEDPDLRLGRCAIALLEAARDVGDPALIAQAEAMAIAVGFALASRLPAEDG
jgi:hypothetical protein